MKINTSKILKVITFLLVNMILLTSCKGNISNQTNLETTSSETTETTAITKTTSTEEITQPTVAETTTAESTTTEPEPIKYTYQLPEEVKNIHWSTDDIIQEIQYNYYKNDEQIYNIISSQLVSKMSNLMSNLMLENSFYNDNGYLAWIGIMEYDLNSDGVKDYLLEGVVKENGYVTENVDELMDWRFNAVYVSQDNNTFKFIKSHSFIRVPTYILSTKTNGLNDIKVLENSSDPVIRYDGKDSYSEMQYIDEKHLFIDNDTVINNRLIEFNFLSGSGTDEEKYYVVIKLSDDNKLKKDVIYSCEADGTPIVYTEDYNLGAITGYKFYAELKENYEIPEDIEDIKNDRYRIIKISEIRYVPVK